MLDQKFNKERSRLFSLAYKMLGSISDAEDVMQDAWLKWSTLEHETILSPPAYLSRMVSRLCIDTLRKREKTNYKGPWLPEPLQTGEENTTTEKVDLYKELSVAFLFLLEKLKPEERAVFILKEAFDFSHQEISQTLEIETVNSRQLLSRAKKSLKAGRNQEANAADKQLMKKFVSALWNGNLEEAQQLVSEDLVSYSDGGGIVRAALIPIEGRAKVLQVLFHIAAKNQDGASMQYCEINGETGVALYANEELSSVVTFVCKDEKIKEIYIQRNPDKLKHFK